LAINGNDEIIVAGIVYFKILVKDIYNSLNTCQFLAKLYLSFNIQLALLK
jgi:hypothetical protein